MTASPMTANPLNRTRIGAAALGCLVVLALAATPAMAQKEQKEKSKSALAGFDNSNSKEPYKIDANRLEVQQNANKAIYSGDVVVIQGTMTMRCSQLVIFFNQSKENAGKGAATQQASVAEAAGGLKRLECHGPMTINKEKQTATANQLVFENETVTLTGNVVMSDGENVQAGEKMVYNTKSTIGRMEGGRVRGIFTPGSDSKPGQKPKS
jgi:lipopolysaccharide export system protein LptA